MTTTTTATDINAAAMLLISNGFIAAAAALLTGATTAPIVAPKAEAPKAEEIDYRTLIAAFNSEPKAKAPASRRARGTDKATKAAAPLQTRTMPTMPSRFAAPKAEAPKTPRLAKPDYLKQKGPARHGMIVSYFGWPEEAAIQFSKLDTFEVLEFGELTFEDIQKELLYATVDGTITKEIKRSAWDVAKLIQAGQHFNGDEVIDLRAAAVAERFAA